ncbi:ATP-binding protein [Streptomyces sp. YU58]|uniref:ATP-binding protein n=1 Tax=Streptomyces sp. SX92 TaxID=3158972 RepID=UPI0027B8E9CF|nr:PAS domain S-box protein [Streptomyces coralus]WLW55377.1 PAS domain S-box protein [Streptomyces coralus]
MTVCVTVRPKVAFRLLSASLGVCPFVAALDVLLGDRPQIVALLVIAPLLACTRLGVRATALVACFAAASGFAAGFLDGTALTPVFLVRWCGLLLGCVLTLGVASRRAALEAALCSPARCRATVPAPREPPSAREADRPGQALPDRCRRVSRHAGQALADDPALALASAPEPSRPMEVAAPSDRTPAADRAAAHARVREVADLAERSPVAVLAKTLDGRITYWNAAAQRLYGYLPKEAIGAHVSMLAPPERRDEIDDLLARLGRGERIEHFATRCSTSAGRAIHVDLTLWPLRAAVDGRPVGACVVVRQSPAPAVTERDLAAVPESVAEGRAVLGEFLAERDRDGVADEARLLASEVLTNAVQHGEGPIRLRLSLTEGELTVEVTDRGPGRPRRRHAGSADESGRGLELLDTLAASWGTRPAEDGKTVWFTLPAPP